MPRPERSNATLARARRHFHSSTAQNTHGTMNSVIRLTAIPPTDGIAIGRMMSDPRPLAQKVGMSPKKRLTGTVRHWSSGLRMMMLSIMPIGAGSKADSARPILPTTDSTSGTLAMAKAGPATN